MSSTLVWVSLSPGTDQPSCSFLPCGAVHYVTRPPPPQATCPAVVWITPARTASRATRRAAGGHREGATPHGGGPFTERVFGGDLLSHTVSRAVPSALKGLASGFGMGPGVSPSL